MKIQNLIISTLSFYMILISASCTDDGISPREYPRLETLEVTNISESGATFNAKIFHPGNQKILEYGFVWGWYRYDPDLGSNRVFLTETLTKEEFSSNITTTLYKNQNYNVRAFIKTEEYTVYGNSMPFKSLGSKGAIIDDFFPKKGTWGDTIQITGKNFSYLSVYNKIFFKDVKSKVISSTDSIIKCIVPDGISGKTVPIYLDLAGQKTYAKEEFELLIPVTASF
jgi:IPT/TIG domain-containing protein